MQSSIRDRSHLKRVDCKVDTLQECEMGFLFKTDTSVSQKQTPLKGGHLSAFIPLKGRHLSITDIPM